MVTEEKSGVIIIFVPLYVRCFLSLAFFQKFFLTFDLLQFEDYMPGSSFVVVICIYPAFCSEIPGYGLIYDIILGKFSVTFCSLSLFFQYSHYATITAFCPRVLVYSVVSFFSLCFPDFFFFF